MLGSSGPACRDELEEHTDSDGYLMVRHPDWDEAYRLSFLAATGIQMYAD